MPTALCNVSAKDLGTGNEQKITITASTNLSEEEIEKAVTDAEKYAEEDKKSEGDRSRPSTMRDSIAYQMREDAEGSGR